jgi:hypothetical protein
MDGIVIKDIKYYEDSQLIELSWYYTHNTTVEICVFYHVKINIITKHLYYENYIITFTINIQSLIIVQKKTI